MVPNIEENKAESFLNSLLASWWFLSVAPENTKQSLNYQINTEIVIVIDLEKNLFS